MLRSLLLGTGALDYPARAVLGWVGMGDDWLPFANYWYVWGALLTVLLVLLALGLAWLRACRPHGGKYDGKPYQHHPWEDP